MTRHEPKPVDEGLPLPETRGGNRPEDYMPGSSAETFPGGVVPPSRRNGQFPGAAPLDVEEAFDEPPGGNDPEAQ